MASAEIHANRGSFSPEEYPIDVGPPALYRQDPAFQAAEAADSLIGNINQLLIDPDPNRTPPPDKLDSRPPKPQDNEIPTHTPGGDAKNLLADTDELLVGIEEVLEDHQADQLAMLALTAAAKNN